MDGCFCLPLRFFGFLRRLASLIPGINGCAGEPRAPPGDSLTGRNTSSSLSVVCIRSRVFLGLLFGEENGFKDALVSGIFSYVSYICSDPESGAESVLERKSVYEGGPEYGGGIWEQLAPASVRRCFVFCKMNGLEYSLKFSRIAFSQNTSPGVRKMTSCDMDPWLYIGPNGCPTNWKAEPPRCIGAGGSCLNESSGREMGCEGSSRGEFFLWRGPENGEVDLHLWMG